MLNRHSIGILTKRDTKRLTHLLVKLNYNNIIIILPSETDIHNIYNNIKKKDL